MTTLTKPVRRRLANSSYRGRRFVIELRPGSIETLFIREEGRRKGYTVPFGFIFSAGARIEADSIRKERAARRKAKKQQKEG